MEEANADEVKKAEADLGSVLQNNPDLIKTSAGTYGVEATKKAITITPGTTPVEPAPIPSVKPIKATTPPSR